MKNTNQINHQEETDRLDSQSDVGRVRPRRTALITSIILVVLIALFITGIIFLLQPSTDTARIRDIFIIILALESILSGFALIILVIQLAQLTNLLQNEIKPILDATNETISNLRGTTTFLSENLVEPVIKLNEYIAALSQLFGLLHLGRRSVNSKSTKERGV